MANSVTSPDLQHAGLPSGFGRSTLVTTPNLSIPMPSGATPPPAPPAQPGGISGTAPDVARSGKSGG
jgi:hypothetical protein